VRRWARARRAGHGDGGFTLTELVIAMVVLGVLASIAVPSFLGSRDNAYDKEAQTSVEVVLRAAKFLYQSQGDFTDASSAQCGDSTALANDLQKIDPNVEVVASSVSSTSSRIVSVQAVQTWDSTGGLLGCQGFYAVAFSSSGSCWAARIILEGKYLASGGGVAGCCERAVEYIE
jgi:prepilin-type N-terminal cleavage/methylation domain-containing protein